MEPEIHTNNIWNFVSTSQKARCVSITYTNVVMLLKRISLCIMRQTKQLIQSGTEVPTYGSKTAGC